jgi:putative ABC transport system permease protein
VVAEAAVIGALGAAVGFVIYLGLMVGVAHLIRAQTGVVLDVLAGHPVLWACPLGMIALCALGGIVPALKAYRTPVAENLTPVS